MGLAKIIACKLILVALHVRTHLVIILVFTQIHGEHVRRLSAHRGPDTTALKHVYREHVMKQRRNLMSLSAVHFALVVVTTHREHVPLQGHVLIHVKAMLKRERAMPHVLLRMEQGTKLDNVKTAWELLLQKLFVVAPELVQT